MPRFVEALCSEIAQRATQFSDSQIPAETIFIGGGTPSLLKPEYLDRIFSELGKWFDLSRVKETTIECNPGTITLPNLIDYRRIGINRLSIGVQSFVKEELEFLQRIHTPGEAEESIRLARHAGFDNISIDLIFSIPGQTAASLDYTLKKAIGLKPEHISAYSLIYEPETPLYDEFTAGRISKTDDDTDSELYSHIINTLLSNGYSQYEISNFSLNGRKCLHNLKYWKCEEYFGFGPSAHGYLNGERYWNHKNMNEYFKSINDNKLPTKGSEILSRKDMIVERIYLGLRAEGIDTREINNEFGIDLTVLLSGMLKEYEKEGFLKVTPELISLTGKGYAVCDGIAAKIISEIFKK